jgi:tRNA A-37 threonylcarbamoyl transferase component Bud32
MMDVVRDRFIEIHPLSVVQGDVARRNILIHQGHPYIIDFGYCELEKRTGTSLINFAARK